jgi:quercetin dioxygenase-like cupin family protein
MRRLGTRGFLLGALIVGLSAAAAWAQPSMIENLSEAQWGPAPPMLPPGAELEVVGGNPGGETLFTIRVKMPAGYKIPAHSHPRDEHVTVLSGTLYIGMGDKLDAAAGKALAVGGFALMPANHNHFAYCKEPTIILVHGQGPLEFKYVNPADDPRNQKPAAGH